MDVGLLYYSKLFGLGVEITKKKWVNMGYDLENLTRSTNELNEGIKGKKRIRYVSYLRKDNIKVFKSVPGIGQT